MSRAKRLAPVQDLVDDAERRLASSLATLERHVVDAQNKLDELRQYHSEYEKQLAQRASSGMAAADLRDYQVFLTRLREVISQQHSAVQRTAAACDAERACWRQAAQRVKAIDHVVTQWQTAERRIADNRAQHETDERALRPHGTDQRE